MATGTGTMYRVIQTCSGVAGTPWYITGYFDLAVGTAQQAADAWRNFIVNTSTQYMTGLIFNAISQVEYVDPSNGNLLAVAPVTVASLSCIGGTDPLPFSTTLLVEWRTGERIAGREIRGRTNLSGLMESQSSGGNPDSTTLSAYQTRINALVGSVTSRRVVWSRKAGVWAPVSSALPWSKWAVLRSRRD